MKLKSLLIGLTAGLIMLAPLGVSAATFTTDNEILSLETPDDNWRRTSDPNYWFTISDGRNFVAIDHLSNGEKLPDTQIADQNYQGVVQCFVSTNNEVFVVTGMASQREDVGTIMQILGTIKVLRYDTKTAVATVAASTYGLRPINQVYTCTADVLYLRSSYSANSDKLGSLSEGDTVTVVGMVTFNGQDIGWYQVNVNGLTAYALGEYLSPRGGSQNASAGSGTNVNHNLGHNWVDTFTVYYEDGSVAGTMYQDSDVQFYLNGDLESRFEYQGNGVYSNVQFTVYAYSSSTPSGSKQDWVDSFVVYQEDGSVVGSMYQDSNNQFYLNADLESRFEYQGNGVYSNVQFTVYAYNPVSSDPGHQGSEGIAASFPVWNSAGQYMGSLVLYTNGNYYLNDNTAQQYYDLGGQEYSGPLGLVYGYNPATDYNNGVDENEDVVDNGGGYENNDVDENEDVVDNGGGYENNDVDENEDVVDNGGGYENNDVDENEDVVDNGGGYNNGYSDDYGGDVDEDSDMVED